MSTEPSDLIDGRDVELIAVGILCLVGAGAWIVLPIGPIDWRPVVIFVMMGGVSFGLAWWDVRTRGELSVSTDDDER